MALSTVELRNLLKTDFKLFDFDYEFDDLYMKAKLEQAVIDYYFFSEIGQETPDRFKHVFKTRWLRIIPTYNKLHNTTLLNYDPLTSYKTVERLDQLQKSLNKQDSNSGTNMNGKNNTTQDISGSDKESDYPQQPIAGSDFASAASTSSSHNVAENITNNSSSTSANLKDEGEVNTNYEKTIEGITGITYQDLIKKERDNIINIVSMVIKDLKPCFMLTY